MVTVIKASVRCFKEKQNTASTSRLNNILPLTLQRRGGCVWDCGHSMSPFSSTKMCLWSTDNAARGHPSRCQLSRGNHSASADRHAQGQMEHNQAHQDLPNGRLRGNRVPGGRIHQQGHGETLLPSFWGQKQHETSQYFIKKCRICVTPFPCSGSIFESPMTPNPTTSCT